MSQHFTAEERETTVNASDADDVVRIWTAQKRYITAMRRNPAFVEVKTGFHGTTEFSVFEVEADRWSPVGVKRRLNLSSEQRNARANHLRALREDKK